jgi:hypothetical protein
MLAFILSAILATPVTPAPPPTPSPSPHASPTLKHWPSKGSKFRQRFAPNPSPTPSPIPVDEE